MADPSWPEAGKRRLIGTRVKRVDGPAKATGRAKYTYDVNRPRMLFARLVRCPHAHARVVAVDVSAAEKMPGVRAVRVLQGPGSEIQWALDEVAVVAAASEEAAEDAARAVEVEYQVLPHFVGEEALEKAPRVEPAQEETKGDVAAALAEAKAVAEGTYGLAPIAHSCLEAHGHVCEWDADGNLTVWASTQNVSGLGPQLAEATGVEASRVRVITEHMGGGFGSKFGPDRWGVACAELARAARAPVKLMLDRASELAVAGDRPSAHARVKVAAAADGALVAWESRSWGSGGPGGSGSPPLPYLFEVPNRRHQHSSVPTHRASARAWRAPNHPQACLITLAALEDLAAALGMDPLDLVRRNLELTGPRARTYAEELEVGARLIDWKKRWRPRGQSGTGAVRTGLGLSLHTWGGRGHRSSCEVVVSPDGAVEARIGTQDLGTGTRTVIALVLAETLGLRVEEVRVSIGESRYPASGASGGSTTVGGVSAATRRAALHALEQVLARVAPHLGAGPGDLEAAAGKVQVKGDPGRSLSWRKAAGLLGGSPITATGANPGPGSLTDSGVGGIQMAEAAVDVETGVVRVVKLVAVQDCGLVLDLETARSQVLGGMIMGIAYALGEEKVYDPLTGRLLNDGYDFYKLPGIADVGELEAHLMTGPGYDERGVIGLGEPPVISPGAALSNAVANAIGVRVSGLPLTPDRVLESLEKGPGA